MTTLVAVVGVGVVSMASLVGYSYGVSQVAKPESLECGIALLFIEPDQRQFLTDEEIADVCDVNTANLAELRAALISASAD